MNLKFDVTGMTCAACSARVEKVTAAVPGVDQVEVNLLAGTMQVKTENESCTEAIISAVQNAGYGAAIHGQNVAKAENKKTVQDELKQMKVRIISSLVFLLILMYFTMGHMVGLPMPSWYIGAENALVATLLQFFLTLPPVLINYKDRKSVV